jgi:hypothetical protein
LKLASELEPEHYHPETLAPLHARDYRDAIGRVARYKQLCCPEEVHITTRGDECTIETIWLYPDGEVPPLLTDAVFASFVELGRRGTQTRLSPKRVELKRTPELNGVHEGFFNCPVKFRARRNVLLLHTSDLDRPFATHNGDLLEMLNPQLDKTLEGRKAKARISDQVKWVLKRLLRASCRGEVFRRVQFFAFRFEGAGLLSSPPLLERAARSGRKAPARAAGRRSISN